MLPGVNPVDLDSAGVRPLEGHADADEGRLPGTVRPDQRGDAAGGDRQIHLVERDLLLEALAQTVGRQRSRADRSPSVDYHSSLPTPGALASSGLRSPER
jgi:hypothetical protein